MHAGRLSVFAGRMEEAIRRKAEKPSALRLSWGWIAGGAALQRRARRVVSGRRRERLFARAAPKEQPPRKLSGKRTTTQNIWKEATLEAPADGITFSGTSDRWGDPTGILPVREVAAMLHPAPFSAMSPAHPVVDDARLFVVSIHPSSSPEDVLT